MATTTKDTKIKLTFAFADSETRLVELGPYNSTDSAVQNAKPLIRTFNVTPIAGLFLSDEGASCTGIVEAHIQTVTKKELDISSI